MANCARPASDRVHRAVCRAKAPEHVVRDIHTRRVQRKRVRSRRTWSRQVI
jgi:hypothetical protein